MFKKYMSIVAVSVLSASMLIGCGKTDNVVNETPSVTQNQNDATEVEQVVDSPEVFVATGTTLDETSPLLQSYLFTQREEMLNSMKWFAMTESDISFQTTKEYSEVKDLTFGEATLLKAQGEDKMEGSELLASRSQTTNLAKVWDEAFGDFDTTYTITLYSQTKSAKTLFGSKIAATPFIAISETFGNPTTMIAADNGNVLLTYQFKEFSCIVTVFDKSEGDEHNQINVCVQKNFL